MSLLTTVTEAEAKVVDAVRDLRQPVVGYLQRGVDLAGGRLPKVSYPARLPQPGEILDSQYTFLSDLLAAQYELVKAVTATVAPLVGAQAKPARTTRSPKADAKSPSADKAA